MRIRIIFPDPPRGQIQLDGRIQVFYNRLVSGVFMNASKFQTFVAVLVFPFLFCAGCASIAAEHILTQGSNRGGKPFPKTLELNPLFDGGYGIRVQDHPPVNVLFWVMEPKAIQVWVGEEDDVAAPQGWMDDSSGHGFSALGPKNARVNIRFPLCGSEAYNAAKLEPIGTVIILQGQGGCVRTHAGTWPIAAALANAGYRVILPDLRSQGDSTGKNLGFVVYDAEDISKIIDRLEQEHLLAGRIGVLGGGLAASVGAGLANPALEAFFTKTL